MEHQLFCYPKTMFPTRQWFTYSLLNFVAWISLAPFLILVECVAPPHMRQRLTRTSGGEALHLRWRSLAPRVAKPRHGGEQKKGGSNTGARRAGKGNLHMSLILHTLRNLTRKVSKTRQTHFTQLTYVSALTHMLLPYTSHSPHTCQKTYMWLNLHMSLHLHMLLNSNKLLYFDM